MKNSNSSKYIIIGMVVVIVILLILLKVTGVGSQGYYRLLFEIAQKQELEQLGQEQLWAGNSAALAESNFREFIYGAELFILSPKGAIISLLVLSAVVFLIVMIPRWRKGDSPKSRNKTTT